MRSIGLIAVLICAMAALAACSSGGSGNGTPSAGVGTGGGAGNGGSGSGGSGNDDPDSPFRTIGVTAIPPAGGSVDGAREYELGETAKLEATANLSYVFAAWIEGEAVDERNGTLPFSIIGRDATLEFPVTQGRNLGALFRTQSELLAGLYSGVPKSPSATMDEPSFSSLSIEGTAIQLTHVRTESLPGSFNPSDIPWCRYIGTLSGIELPATAAGTFECGGGDDRRGSWNSSHIAKTDADAFIMEMTVTPTDAQPHSEKHSGFMILLRDESVPPHHRRLTPWSATEVTPGDLAGIYQGVMKVNGLDCAPHDNDMVLAETRITLPDPASDVVQIHQIPDMGSTCIFTGQLDDIAATPPLTASGTYDCSGDSGTWTSPRLALTSPARDSILIDLTVEVPARSCSYRLRSIGFE